MYNFALRDYQEAAQIYINKELNSNFNPLTVMSCGTGKSKVIAAVCADRISLKERVLVIAPQDVLFEQLFIELEFLNAGYINSDGVIGRDRNVYVAMPYSLKNILEIIPEKFCKSFSTIIIDETQFVSADTWRTIIKHFSHCNIAGLTATPYRLDNQNLGEFYDSMFEPIKKSEAIKRGFLTKSILVVPEIFKDLAKNRDEKKIESILKDKKIIGDVVKTYNDLLCGRPVIVPCRTKKFAKEIIEMFERAGWNAVLIEGSHSLRERIEIIKKVKSGKINQLVTCGVGIYGMDIPELAGIIWMELTESITKYDQLNGRPARPFAGKKYSFVIDPCGNFLIHGHPDVDRDWSIEKDYVSLLDDEEKIKMKLCPNCKNANSLLNNNCNFCGFDFSIELEKENAKTPDIISENMVISEPTEFLKDVENFIFENRINQKLKNEKLKDEETEIKKNITQEEKLKLLNGSLMNNRRGIFFENAKKFL